MTTQVDAVLAVLRAALPAEPFCRLHAAAVKDARLGRTPPAAEWTALCTTLLDWLRGGRLRALNHDDDAEEEESAAAEATTTPATAASAWEALLNSDTHMRLRTAVAGMPVLLPAASAASAAAVAASSSAAFSSTYVNFSANP
jgi:hypothetical protein